MGINELVLRKKAPLSTEIHETHIFNEVPVVNYSLVDATKYSFEYEINDDVEVRMFESDRTFDSNDFIDADFDDSISEKDYSYYAVAVASGVLTGVISQLKLSKEDLDRVKEWKNKDWDKYITIAAHIAGYDKSDIKGAIAFLKERFIPYAKEQLDIEVQDGIDAWLNMLSSHPSVAGLVFSVFSQFGEKRYSLGDKGIISEPLPDYYAIGRDSVEKIVYGFLYWIFNLAVDVAVSRKAILEEMKIPKEMLLLLKELYKLPLFREIPKNHIEAEEVFSKWIVKIFEKSQYTDEEGYNGTFNLRDAIDSLGSRAFEINTPVIINECIVRTFYLLKKLIAEIKDKDIKRIDELEKIEVEKILPFNNRLISRIVLVSSACFMGINVAGAAVKAIYKEKKGKDDFREVLMTEINFAGIGRFVFACVADSKYWSDDIKIFLQRKGKKKQAENIKDDEKVVEDMISNDSFKALSLTPAQTRALFSLKSLTVTKDIEHTSKADEKAKKQRWHELWKGQILAGMGLESEEYFVTDEKTIYDSFNSLDQDNENLRWFYLMAMEYIVFEPYYPLGVKDDSDFRKLHSEKYNYIDDQFARRQTIINQAEIDSVREAYKKYKGYVSGNSQNAIIAAGVTVVAAVAAGGLAFVFAPGIASLIAGEAVVGLHGAALASASLAYVGGGSLAAGGMGMAGGTAIITGGGALLGIAGSGSASMAAILSQTSSEYWMRQTTKLLVFSKSVLKDRLSDSDAIKNLSAEVSATIEKVERNLKELEVEDCSLDKEAVKNTKNCLKYLSKCKAELEKLV